MIIIVVRSYYDKIRFFNENYNLDEIREGYTDGNLDNFKGDEDFLEFLISWTLGNCLEGPEEADYRQWADYEGILSISMLDQYDMLGSKLYQIYELCDKDKLTFIRACHHIGEYTLSHTFNRNTVETNLMLSHPVKFIDEDIVLSDGTKPIYDYERGITDPYHLARKGDLQEEYNYELERSLRKRINESIKTHGDTIEPLEEMIPYNEKERLEREKKEAQRVKDDYEIEISNIYFGKQEIDLSGGIFGLNMTMISWFEDTNIGVLNYRIFRNVPDGEYCMLDDQGKIHIPEQIINHGNINVGPQSSIRTVEIASIPQLFDKTLNKLEEKPIENEMTILNLKGAYEAMSSKGKLSVAELKQYEPLFRTMYEGVYGDIFGHSGDEINDAIQHK